LIAEAMNLLQVRRKSRKPAKTRMKDPEPFFANFGSTSMNGTFSILPYYPHKMFSDDI
jgi:hypothetical protein